MSLKKESICLIEGPFGKFTLNEGGKRQIWAAGGIGITPFLSMARDLKADRKIDLFYSVKNEGEAFFADEIKEIEKQKPNFKMRANFSETDGYLTADKIKSWVDLDDADVFLCGPLPFMHGLRDQFEKLGVKKERIYSEEFNLY